MVKEEFETAELCLNEDGKQFFKLFQESTFEGSRAAALEMMNIAKRQTKERNKFLLFHSLDFLVYFSNSEMLSWPNSPLLVLLELDDSNELAGSDDTQLQEGEATDTPLQYLANLLDPFNDSTHVNQLVLAKQLIEHGAEVNAIPHGARGATPLHTACYGGNVTNLDFVELLLEEGADVNAQDHSGMTPLMYTNQFAPGAAKFLLNWPTTDINIINARGESILVRARHDVTFFSNKVALLDNPERVQHKFLLRQWRKIEKMLVEMGAHDTGITAIE
jgi:hypothetical protein